MSSTPGWLLSSEVGLCPCGCVGKRRRGSFVDKTLDGAARVMHQALFADDVAAGRGLLQRIEPRVKLVSILGLLVAAALAHRIPTLLALYGATLGLAVASGVSLGFFVRRVWLFVPIFTGIVVLPATLNVVTHGDVVVPLGTWFGHELGMTAQGLTAAGLIVSRVATSISLVVLLTLTTAWPRLLAALRALRVPALFVLVLGMAYRYVFHLLGAVGDMFTARKARLVRAIDTAAGRRFVAASAGALFGRSHALAEEVHMAMVARGYTGDVRTLAAERIGARELAWLAACLVAAAALWGIDHGLA